MSNQINETLLENKIKQKTHIDEILFISQKWMRRKKFLNKTWKENHEKMLKYKENFRTRKKIGKLL